MTEATELTKCLEESVPSTASGIVIKATDLHSNKGVYVLVDYPNHEDPKELLRGSNMALSEIMSRLSFLEATKIIVEEFVGDEHAPAEYKLHVVDGQVAAIDVIQNRGSDCACYGVVDTDWNRLDQSGCFE